jgi:hypothetical protein
MPNSEPRIAASGKTVVPAISRTADGLRPQRVDGKRASGLSRVLISGGALRAGTRLSQNFQEFE